MSLILGDNFSYQGAKPLDGRLKYDTVAAMKAMADSILYDGCLAYCVETDKTYQWKSTNEVDADLGRWREFSSTVDSAISSTSENPVQNKAIHDALDGKADLVNGKVPAAQLPAYVDDVIEGYYKEADDRFYEESTYETLITPEGGKSWVDISTNKSYRWTGDRYVRVDEGVQLGETADTAYRGDRGKVAYDISQTIGDVANLNTTEKSSVIEAINEVQNFNNLTNRPVKEVTSISDIISPLPVDNKSKWSEKNGILFYDDKVFAWINKNNITMYVNSETGVDNFDGGYGFSADKPFKSISYAYDHIPTIGVEITNTYYDAPVIQLYIQGTFSANSFTQLRARHGLPIYIYLTGDTIFNNIGFRVEHNQSCTINLGQYNLTMNYTLTTLSYSVNSFICANVSHLYIYGTGKLTINGNSDLKAITYLVSVTCAGRSNISIVCPMEVNTLKRVFNLNTSGTIYIENCAGSGNTDLIYASQGGVFSYNTITADGNKRTMTGGRIYTGSQS